MTKLCDINPGAKAKLPPAFAEKSGIGSHYVDAFLKPMNVKLPDGTRVGCKRKGLNRRPTCMPSARATQQGQSDSSVMTGERRYCLPVEDRTMQDWTVMTMA